MLPPSFARATEAVTGAQIEQARLFDTEAAMEAPERDPRRMLVQEWEIPATPGDPDLGQQLILHRQERIRLFSIFANAGWQHTNNVGLTRTGTLSDNFFFGQVGAAFQPRLSRRLLGELYVRQSFFRYDRFDVLDFNNFTVGTGLTLPAPEIWDLAFSLRYHFTRLADGSSNQEFFRSHNISLSIQKIFPISRAHYAYANLTGLLSFSEPRLPERDEYALLAGYFAQITRSLQANASYRIAYYRYPHQDRNDLNQILTFMLSYSFTDWASLQATTSFAFNHSEFTVFNYQVINAGAGLNLAVRF